jgi:hypothetical protein
MLVWRCSFIGTIGRSLENSRLSHYLIADWSTQEKTVFSLVIKVGFWEHKVRMMPELKGGKNLNCGTKASVDKL